LLHVKGSLAAFAGVLIPPAYRATTQHWELADRIFPRESICDFHHKRKGRLSELDAFRQQRVSILDFGFAILDWGAENPKTSIRSTRGD
jgi:hypothetical protein